MNKMTAHEKLLNEIKLKISHKENIANTLMDILYIGKEAVYRRLRGEVQFTLQEAEIISRELHISLDGILESDLLKSRPFRLNLIEYIDPLEPDFRVMKEFIDVLKLMRDDPDSEIGSAANILPQSIYMKYEYLTKFYFFKWTYQFKEEGLVKPMCEIEINNRLKGVFKEFIAESMQIKNTYYVWDNSIFLYLVNDIKYFYKIGYILQDEIVSLKSDLLRFLDDLEELAAKGKFETGNNVSFYISNINIESTYSYVQTQDYKISLIKAFSLNSVASVDEKTFEKVKVWVNSFKRLSTLISESGEIQRVRFFNKQREIINLI